MEILTQQEPNQIHTNHFVLLSQKNVGEGAAKRISRHMEVRGTEGENPQGRLCNIAPAKSTSNCAAF
jgi:hypothetical protein